MYCHGSGRWTEKMCKLEVPENSEGVGRMMMTPRGQLPWRSSGMMETFGHDCQAWLPAMFFDIGLTPPLLSWVRNGLSGCDWYPRSLDVHELQRW